MGLALSLHKFDELAVVFPHLIALGSAYYLTFQYLKSGGEWGLGFYKAT